MTHVKKTSCAVVVWMRQLIPGDGHVDNCLFCGEHKIVIKDNCL